METILITGGTGLVGRYLCNTLTKEGYEVILLSRRENKQAKFVTYKWDYNQGEVDPEAIKKADYIVHLAGEPLIGKRWSVKQKKVIIDSRVKTGELLVEAVKEYNPKLKGFVSASGVGWYGAVTEDTICTEEQPAHADFLGHICDLWERPLDSFRHLGFRAVGLRIGVVLAHEGGALEQMSRPVKIGLGAAFGNGKQYMPWIHIEDLCKMILHSIQNNQLNGSYNAVAPEYVNNKEVTKMIAKVLKKPLWSPNVPGFVMRLILGETADVLLYGSKVSPEKVQKTGFRFQFPKLEPALKELFGKE